KTPRATPFGRDFDQRYGSSAHHLIIQLCTSAVNRAATRVSEALICTAITSASASSEPSRLVSRSRSPNSIGRAQRKITSRAVPYSRTVRTGSDELPPTCETSTGIFTLVPSGKNCASRSKSSGCAEVRFPIFASSCLSESRATVIAQPFLSNTQSATVQDVQSGCQIAAASKLLITRQKCSSGGLKCTKLSQNE